MKRVNLRVYSGSFLGFQTAFETIGKQILLYVVNNYVIDGVVLNWWKKKINFYSIKKSLRGCECEGDYIDAFKTNSEFINLFADDTLCAIYDSDLNFDK